MLAVFAENFYFCTFKSIVWVYHVELFFPLHKYQILQIASVAFLCMTHGFLSENACIDEMTRFCCKVSYKKIPG